MSNSRKKTHICGNVKARSEKTDKQIANRRLRRRVRQGDWHLLLRDVSTTWNFAKDGRHYFNAAMHPKLMRK